MQYIADETTGPGTIAGSALSTIIQQGRKRGKCWPGLKKEAKEVGNFVARLWLKNTVGRRGNYERNHDEKEPPVSTCTPPSRNPELPPEVARMQIHLEETDFIQNEVRAASYRNNLNNLGFVSNFHAKSLSKQNHLVNHFVRT